MRKSVPSAHVDVPKTASLVQAHLERLILSGVLRPGDRLPGERELGRTLDVSRPVLRDALKQLAARDLIRTTQGGGSYVNARLGHKVTDPLAHLLKTDKRAHTDLLEYRSDLESAAAAHAALRATQPDRDILELLFSQMMSCHETRNAQEEALLDSKFHMAIAEASHNLIFVHVTLALQQLLQQDLLNSRIALYDRHGVREALLNQHREIRNAILSQDPDGARSAMRQHLQYVKECFQELDQQGEREASAQQRLLRLRKTNAVST